MINDSLSQAQKPHDHQTLAKLPVQPIDRLWNGDKEGKITFPGIPKFEDKIEERQWVREHMAGAFRMWGKLGFCQGPAGHISVRDPILRDHIWMNPLGMHFSSIKAADLVLVSPEGFVTEHGAQSAVNKAGFYIHSSVHQARHDIEAVAHCHSIHAKTWSVFGKPIEMLSQDSCVFYDNLAVYANFGGIVLAPQGKSSCEGKHIAEALGPKHRACILQNHGSLTLGTTVDEAALLLSALEAQCYTQLLAEAATRQGLQKTLIDDEDARFTAATTQDPDVLYMAAQTEYNQLRKDSADDFLF